MVFDLFLYVTAEVDKYSRCYVLHSWQVGKVGKKVSCMAVPWLRRLVAGLSQRRPEYAPGLVHVGLIVNKVAVRQVCSSSSVLLCHYHSILALNSHILSVMSNRPVKRPQFRDVSLHRHEQQ
jgi:hypothetical protein